MQKDYLIEKRPVTALTILALPMIIGNLFQQIYTMADSAIVGRYVGEQAFAAVGASHALTEVFICIAIGGGVGASVVVGQYFGAREYGRMKAAISTAMLAFLALSVALSGFGLLLSRQIMLWLNTPADTLDMAALYLRIYFFGLPFLFMYNILSAMFNALGKSRIPLYFLIFSSAFNVVLDLVMVLRLQMGVAGVAWATVVAQGISAMLSFAVFLRELRQLEGTAPGLFDRDELLGMGRIALPSILQQSTISIGTMLIQSVVNSFGSAALAGYTAAMRMDGLLIVPMTSTGSALSAYTAQNIGADRKERVVKGYHTALGMVVFFGALSWLLLQLCSREISVFFLGEEATAVALSTSRSCLLFKSWFYCFIGFKITTDGVLRGAGDMFMFTVANFANLFLRVFLSVTLAPRFGIAMVWMTVPLGWLLNWAISYAEYRTGKWKTMRKK